MKTEVITMDVISTYIAFLSNDEISGIAAGQYFCMGAFDEKSNEAMGIVVARVLPRYILIEKLFTAEKYRGQGVAKGLLEVITDMPPEISIPSVIISAERSIDENWILKQGFEPIVIATKADKINRSQLAKQVKAVKEGLKVVPGTMVIPFSATSKQGRDEIYEIIDSLIEEQ